MSAIYKYLRLLILSCAKILNLFLFKRQSITHELKNLLLLYVSSQDVCICNILLHVRYSGTPTNYTKCEILHIILRKAKTNQTKIYLIAHVVIT